MMQIRDRIKELRRVRARDLLANKKIGGSIRKPKLLYCAGSCRKSVTRTRCSRANCPTADCNSSTDTSVRRQPRRRWCRS